MPVRWGRGNMPRPTARPIRRRRRKGLSRLTDRFHDQKKALRSPRSQPEIRRKEFSLFLGFLGPYLESIAMVTVHVVV